MERCELTELLVRECAHCRPLPAWLDELRRDLLAQPGWVTATQMGTCAGCGDDYAPGAAIRPLRGHPYKDGQRCVLAECCADKAINNA